MFSRNSNFFPHWYRISVRYREGKKMVLKCLKPLIVVDFVISANIILNCHLQNQPDIVT